MVLLRFFGIFRAEKELEETILSDPLWSVSDIGKVPLTIKLKGREMHCIKNKYIVAILVLLCVALPRAKTHAAEITYFYDDFVNNAYLWSTRNDESATLAVSNGYYNFEHKKKKGPHYTFRSIDLISEYDFKIETSIKKVGGYLKNGYGLVYGRRDSSNQFEFHVIGTGFYRILKRQNRKIIYLERGKASKAVRTGNGVVNKLTLIKRGNNLTFLVNDTQVFKTKFEPFFGNRIGFLIYKDQQIAIGSFSVTYLDNKYTPTLAKEDQDLGKIVTFLPEDTSKKYLVKAAHYAKKSGDYNTIFQVKLTIADRLLKTGQYSKSADVLSSTFNDLEKLGELRNQYFVINKGYLFHRIADLSGVLKNKINSTKSHSGSLLFHTTLLENCALRKAMNMFQLSGETSEIIKIGLTANKNKNIVMADKAVAIAENSINRVRRKAPKERAYTLITQLQSIPCDRAQDTTVQLLKKMNATHDTALNSIKRLEVAELAYSARGDNTYIRSLLDTVQLDDLSPTSKFTYYWLLKETGN